MKKKWLFVLIFVLFLTAFSGCKSQNSLINNVSELRTDVFYGQSQNYKVKAGYGFKETPFNADGKISEKDYFLTFRLIDREIDDQTYTISFQFGEQNYNADFKLSPVSHSLIASVEIENFNKKSFTIIISNASNHEDVEMASLLPENTLTFTSVLEKLQRTQSDLLKNYADENGNFNAEIHLRVLVKNEKPYWFIGLVEKDKMKAFLMDGLNGEILAVREVL